jgi:predicted phosphodiesterase
MKIALLADIHGNLAALEAVLAELEREELDQIVSLGDVAAMGPWPREVLANLRALKCLTVMGNADAELLTPPSGLAEDDDQSRKFLDMIRWGAEQLDEADLAFLSSFQPTVELALDDAGMLLCCHGSPRSFDDIIRAATPDDELEPMLAGTEARVQAGGHTHTRMLRNWREREIVNPGSVGLAYRFLSDGSVRVPPLAEFAILTARNGAVSIDFRQAAYDQSATVRAIQERAVPHAAWWTEGWA